MSAVSGLLEGKKLVITGVLTDASLAFATAKHAIEQGADIVLTSAGRATSITRRVAKKLPGDTPPDVLDMDVTKPEEIVAAVAEVDQRWGKLDGLLHAIGFAPASCLGGNMFEAPYEDISVAIQISCHSYFALGGAFAPLMRKAGGGSIVGLDFDATRAWPGYNWMGIAKAGFESANRYMARELGQDNIRVNIVAAGPLRTTAAKSIPGFEKFEDAWATRSPLGWSLKEDQDAVGRTCCALFSDWMPKTTGEMIHVDGGYHAMGA